MTICGAIYQVNKNIFSRKKFLDYLSPRSTLYNEAFVIFPPLFAMLLRNHIPICTTRESSCTNSGKAWYERGVSFWLLNYFKNVDYWCVCEGVKQLEREDVMLCWEMSTQWQQRLEFWESCPVLSVVFQGGCCIKYYLQCKIGILRILQSFRTTYIHIHLK